jgi:hypothetical protein
VALSATNPPFLTPHAFAHAAANGLGGAVVPTVSSNGSMSWSNQAVTLVTADISPERWDRAMLMGVPSPPAVRESILA